MTTPVSYRILAALEQRLQDIDPAGGYNTDAGARVVLGVRRVNPDELDQGPVVVVYEIGDEGAADVLANGNSVVRLEIRVEAFVRFDGQASAIALAYLWQDIVRAVFLTDNTLGGLALDMQRGPREFRYPSDGGQLVAVRQAVFVHYFETYGAP